MIQLDLEHEYAGFHESLTAGEMIAVSIQFQRVLRDTGQNRYTMTTEGWTVGDAQDWGIAYPFGSEASDSLKFNGAPLTAPEIPDGDW